RTRARGPSSARSCPPSSTRPAPSARSRMLPAARQHEHVAVLADDADRRAVVRGQCRLREHLCRRALRLDATGGEQEAPVRILPSETEVVHRGEHGQAAVAPELVYELEHLLLPAEVERARRLV